MAGMKGLLTIAILVLAVQSAGCGWRERLRDLLRGEEHGTAAVVVGENVYTLSDLQRFFDSRMSDFRDTQNSSKVKSRLLESFVDEKLLLAQAERVNVQVNPRMLQAMLDSITAADAELKATRGGRDPELERNLAESLKVQQYLHDHLMKGVTVGEEECEEYYRNHIEDYVQNDVVQVREILVDEKSEADKILASLKSNRYKNFSELARVYSKAASASEGGNLGSFQRGELPEEFERVIFSLPPASASRIVRTRYGYHIFLVDERIAAHQQKFYEVKEQIREKLRMERERELVSRELISLMKQIPVEIHREGLDFEYTGNRFSSHGARSR